MRKSRNTEWASFVDQWKTSPRNMRDVKKGDVLVSRAGAQTSILAIPMKVTSVDRTTTKGRTILQGKNLTPTGSKPNQWRGSGATSLGGPNSFKVRVIHSVRSKRLPSMRAPNPRIPRKRKSTATKRRLAKSRRSAGKTEGGVWSRLMKSPDARYFKNLVARRSMTIRKGSKTLKLEPWEHGKTAVQVWQKKGGRLVTATGKAVFDSAKEALDWGLSVMGSMTNPEKMKVISAIRNGPSAGNPSTWPHVFVATVGKYGITKELVMQKTAYVVRRKSDQHAVGYRRTLPAAKKFAARYAREVATRGSRI